MSFHPQSTTIATMASPAPDKSGCSTSGAKRQDTLIHAAVTKPTPFAKSWAHLVAGGLGGMAAATVTAPLDVVRTRLQSSLYKAPSVAPPGVLAAASLRGSLPYYKKTMLQAGWQHVSETLALLSSIRRHEGARALFKGLGATLAGVVPARSIHFFAYGNGKRLLAQTFTGGNEDHALVHLAAGGLAGVVTSTATNPIWLVKTRMQLDRNESARAATTTRKYRNSLDCVRQVVREEGIRGLYKGMSASYLGAFETMFQWAIYEQLKGGLKRREMRLAASGREKTALDRTIDWTGWLGAAATSKLVASLLTYPHEVVRTRLRQVPLASGRPKYSGLINCFRIIWLEEGLRGLYGGMTPHLMRTVPSAAIMFTVYESTLRFLGA